MNKRGFAFTALIIGTIIMTFFIGGSAALAIIKNSEMLVIGIGLVIGLMIMKAMK